MADPALEQLGINVIRGLAMDAPQKANSGHPGTAMALAPLAHVLWTRVMRHDPSAPNRARRLASATAMPTALARPWPRGPVVTSTPRVWPRSG